MLRGLLRIFLFSYSLIFISCSSDSPSEPLEFEECSNEGSVSVSAGTTPTITWEPKCKISWLSVQDRNGKDSWFITAKENIIAPDVEYGVVPEGVIFVGHYQTFDPDVDGWFGPRVDILVNTR